MMTRKRLFSFFASFLFAVSFFAVSVFAETSAERRARLEQELNDLQTQIDAQNAILSVKRSESASLQRDISILNAQIKSAQLNIKATDVAIQGLTQDIQTKQSTIKTLDAKTEREKESLAQILRNTDKIDNYSLAEVLLNNKNLSSFYSDVNSFNEVKTALAASMDNISADKSATEDEKSQLEDKKAEETNLRQLQTLEKNRMASQQAEKNNLLKISKGVEAVYQKVIASQVYDAAAIRAELFNLQGSVAIPFEKALQYAKIAGAKTGVRPAVILGIIAEESNLGENVGTGNWLTDMKSPRDTEPFKTICASLGLNPDQMPVSKKAWYGWGGAMGPAQFIPSTWVLFEDRISAITGNTPPNPWNPEDAFTASALLLADNGAALQTPKAERLAALRYLAGWANATKRAYAFYGDDVMSLAAKYQQQINILGG